ncbi:MAG: hypothetical protein PVF65_00975 [Sphingomonadales bacterium]|jgi:hypothetical protein
MRKTYKILLLSGAALTLQGCFAHHEAIHPGYGNSLLQNKALQVANPAPTYEGPATSSGAKAAIAMERYKTDKVEDLVILRTTTVGNSGGGG